MPSDFLTLRHGGDEHPGGDDDRACPGQQLIMLAEEDGAGKQADGCGHIADLAEIDRAADRLQPEEEGEHRRRGGDLRDDHQRHPAKRSEGPHAQQGENAGELAPEDRERLDVMAGVSAFPMRVKCATLAWHAFEAALRNGAVGATVKTE